MIYHESIQSGLKFIEPRVSTQKGAYVYGTTNMVYAAIFAVIQQTDKPFPPKFGINPSNIYLAERFENQFKSIENIKASIYVLDENNFSSFDNHSAGDEVELRASGIQEVKKEIIIENVIDYLKENGVTFYKYKDREKVGIPKSDKYFVQGILKTYLWKIEDRDEVGLKLGNEFLDDVKGKFYKYNDLLDSFSKIIRVLSNDEANWFIDNMYDKSKDKFNMEVINQTNEYVKNAQIKKNKTNKLVRKLENKGYLSITIFYIMVILTMIVGIGYLLFGG